MDCSTPGLCVHYQLLEFTQIHISIESVMPSNHLILCCPPSFCLQSFPASESFLMGQFFASGGHSIRVPGSASVLPMNIQDSFPLGWTGWISLQSKDSQESSPIPQFKSINSSALSFLYSPGTFVPSAKMSSLNKGQSVHWGFPCGNSGKESSSQCRRLRRCGLIPGWEDPLEEETATRSSILAWGIPWAEEPGGL